MLVRALRKHIDERMRILPKDGLAYQFYTDLLTILKNKRAADKGELTILEEMLEEYDSLKALAKEATADNELDELKTYTQELIEELIPPEIDVDVDEYQSSDTTFMCIESDCMEVDMDPDAIKSYLEHIGLDSDRDEEQFTLRRDRTKHDVDVEKE